MKIRKQAEETMSKVTEASKAVVDSTEWATVALVAVAACAVLALAIATTALITARGAQHV